MCMDACPCGSCRVQGSEAVIGIDGFTDPVHIKSLLIRFVFVMARFRIPHHNEIMAKIIMIEVDFFYRTMLRNNVRQSRLLV